MALPPGDDGAERDLAERLAAAVTIAEDAGRCLLAHLGRLDGVDQKGRGDLVSAADRAAEELIVAALASRFPTDRVVAEEGHDRAGSAAPGGPTWYVDPLDGTTNFVHGLPVFCVSLGLVAGGEPVLGVVHMPALGRTYRAARGGGAWLGERRLRVSAATRLDDALLATGFPYNRYDTAAELLRPVERALRVARGVRAAAALRIVTGRQGPDDQHQHDPAHGSSESSGGGPTLPHPGEEREAHWQQGEPRQAPSQKGGRQQVEPAGLRQPAGQAAD
ncbi:MAG: hypothetical protein KC635_20105 [Myxococcales bacterium]|nr:hypothetical protein [Myxococcales bacterium]